jgi:hypothetical protein
MAAIARLEALLAEKEAELGRRREQLIEQDRQRDAASWAWTRHQITDDDPLATCGVVLPLPRLQIDVAPTWKGWHEFSVELSLLRRNMYGKVVAVPLMATTIQSSTNTIPTEGRSDTVYTGGVGMEARHIEEMLGLPCWVVVNEAHIFQRLTTNAGEAS